MLLTRLVALLALFASPADAFTPGVHRPAVRRAVAPAVQPVMMAQDDGNPLEDIGKKIGDFFSGLMPKEEEPAPPPIAEKPEPEEAPTEAEA